jgi:hypothetical protein
MQVTKRTPAAAALALVLAAPVAAAATSYSNSTAINPTFTGHFFATSHYYTLDLSDGEQIDATLSWSGPNAGNADLDLALSPPGGTCEVLPNPDAECLAGGAADNVNEAACQGEDNPGATDGFGPATESASATADASQTGTWRVYVIASLAVPGNPVQYDLGIDTTDDGADSVTFDQSDQTTNLIRSDAHCEHVVNDLGSPQLATPTAALP